jgi:NitT/TauT family transport system ATP-binding protein
VRTIVENGLPRPRDYRSPGLLQLVDRLHDAITGFELPDVAAAPAAPAAFEPLPRVVPSEVIGLLEYLDARGGQDDVFRIASDTDREFGAVFSVVTAAEILDLVDTPKRQVVLSPGGTRLVRATPAARPAIWREAIRQLRIFRLVEEALAHGEGHRLDREFVLEVIAVNAPNEDWEAMFETFVAWARYGNLFDYDEERGELALPEAA